LKRVFADVEVELCAEFVFGGKRRCFLTPVARSRLSWRAETKLAAQRTLAFFCKVFEAEKIDGLGGVGDFENRASDSCLVVRLADFGPPRGAGLRGGSVYSLQEAAWGIDEAFVGPCALMNLGR